MSKKNILFGLIVLSILVGSLIFLKIRNQNFRNPISSPQKNLSPTPKNASLKEYSDPSGFKFSIPKGLVVTDKKPTDQSIYSQLEVVPTTTSSGKITIAAITSNLKNVDDYFKINKSLSKNLKVDKLKLADLDARQFVSEDKITTVALDKGVLFTIISDLKDDKEFWDHANKTIITSFAFNPPQPQVSDDSSSGQPDDSGVTEEEEIVE